MSSRPNTHPHPEDVLQVLEAIKDGDEARAVQQLEDAKRNGRQQVFASWAMHDGDWDTGEHTLLHWACDSMKLQDLKPGVKSSLAIVKALVSIGISPNVRGQGNSVPLHLISKCSDREGIEILEYLLKQGAKPNCSNDYGYTALHEASTWGSPIGVQMLMENGANPHVLTAERETAFELAENRLAEAEYNGDARMKAQYEKVIELLRKEDSQHHLNSKFYGFFYSGNRRSAPRETERMKVVHMLNSEELKKRHVSMGQDTRWFHLPANNRVWVEKLVVAILEADRSLNESDEDDDEYREMIESEVQSIMSKCGTFTRSRYPARSFRSIPVGTDNAESRRYCDRYAQDDSVQSDGNSKVVCFMSIPFIESDIDAYHGNKIHGHNELWHSVQDKKERLDNLEKAYPSEVFPRLSLDRFYYEALDNDAIESRDRSQIFSQYDTKKRMLHVGQLWALWIGDKTLITASQSGWDDTNIQSPAERFARRYTTASRTNTLHPADICYELQELCVDLVNYHVADDEGIISVHEAYSREISKVSHYMKEQYECYMLRARMIQKAKMISSQANRDKVTIQQMMTEYSNFEHDERAFQNLRSEADDQNKPYHVKVAELADEESKDPGRDALDVRDDISRECEKLAQIMDVIDELNIINTVLDEQYEVAKWSLRGKDPRDYIRDVRPTFRGLLRESEEVRKSIIELLKLREQEVAIRNAVEAAISADEQASTKIAATVFTVVTFIYTPFSFGFSILGSSMAGFSPGYSVGTAICAMVVTLLATVVLIIFLLPILTVAKTPWNSWVCFVTNSTKKVFGMDTKKGRSGETSVMKNTSTAEKVILEAEKADAFIKVREGSSHV